jgi:hypothetical protein
MVWTPGGTPVKRVDIPAQAVFMVLFMIGAGAHMKIFQGNRSRGHKFLFNLFIFRMKFPYLYLALYSTTNMLYKFSAWNVY